jgi:CTP synthase
MVIEAARNLAGLKNANSSEFDEKTSDPVISTMSDQIEIVAGNGQMGASMRLGLYKADLLANSVVANVYGKSQISERHRHRYEVNNEYRDQLSATGLVFSGLSPDKHLVEFVELPKNVHPYYVGTQAHPEFLSRPTNPHPLFIGLIAAAIAKHGK